MTELTETVETKIAKTLPTNFGQLVDGWSEMGTSAHCGPFCCLFCAKNKRDRRVCFRANDWRNFSEC